MKSNKKIIPLLSKLFANLRLLLKKRAVLVLAVVLPLAALFFFVALRTGPLARIPVTAATVEEREIFPALFGVGNVEAKSLFKIGPNQPGRVKQVYVHVGDRVRARQLVAEMERPDLDILQNSDAEREFIRGSLLQEEADAKTRLAEAQRKQSEVLAEGSHATEIEKTVASENVRAAREDLARVSGSAKNPLRVSANLRLLSPVAGLVTQRGAEPGTTVVQGQAVVEVVDPKSLWLNVRFDQVASAGLRSGLQAQILLRSQSAPLTGRVLRIEPVADAITEETLAKVVFEKMPSPLPPIGELAEVTIKLPPLAAKPVIPNASLVRISGELGVWKLENNSTQIRFTPVKAGVADLEGNVQIESGLVAGERVVVYSQAQLKPHSRIKIVKSLVGVKR